MNAITVDRETLHAQVWSRPVRDVCKDYGISDVGLVKVCKKLNVPRPDQGYWLKKKRRKPTALPPLKAGQSASAVIHASSEPKAAKKVEELDAETTDDARAFFAKVTALEPIVVIDRLTRPHALLASEPKRADLTPAAQNLRRYGATSVLVPRARRILHTLLTLVEQCGATVSSKTKGEVEFIDVALGDAKTTFRLREKHVQKKVDKTGGGGYKYWQYEMCPTGLLELSIEHSYRQRLPRRTFLDTEHKKVEDELNTFMVNLARKLAHESAWNVRREREEAVRRKRRQEEQRLQRLREIEATLSKELDERATLLVAVDRMKLFLADPRVEAAASTRCEHGALWLAWARDRTLRLEEHVLSRALPNDALEFLTVWRDGAAVVEQADDEDDDDVDSFDDEHESAVSDLDSLDDDDGYDTA